MGKRYDTQLQKQTVLNSAHNNHLVGYTTCEVIFITKQEYQHIRNLSWDLLIDANITSLPTNIKSIARIYNCQTSIVDYYSLFGNAQVISKNILAIMGYKTSSEYKRCLATRILAPAIILKELNVQSANDIMQYTHLPQIEAIKRFERLQTLIQRNRFGMSNMEIKVLKQFQPWINTKLV